MENIENTENNEDLIDDIINSEVENKKFKKFNTLEPLNYSEMLEIEKEHWYYKYRIEALERLIKPYITDNNKIIDIGIGTGTISKYMDTLNKNIIHIDNNEELINKNKEILNNCKYGEVPWNVNLKDNEYDIIFLLNFIEYIENEHWCFDLMKNKLNKNGKLIISTLIDPKLYGLNDKLYGIKRRYLFKDLKELLYLSGLKIDNYTYFQSGAKFKKISDMTDIFLSEDKIYLNTIPLNNDKLYENLKKDFHLLGIKQITSGSQIFLECSPITDEDRFKEREKENKFDDKIAILDNLIDKFVDLKKKK